MPVKITSGGTKPCMCALPAVPKTAWYASWLPVITYSVQLFGKLNDQRIYQETIETHRQVVDAIAAHDSDAAREYMYRHLSGNLASITEQEQLQMKEKKTRRPAKTKQ